MRSQAVLLRKNLQALDSRRLSTLSPGYEDKPAKEARIIALMQKLNAEIEAYLCEEQEASKPQTCSAEPEITSTNHTTVVEEKTHQDSRVAVICEKAERYADANKGVDADKDIFEGIIDPLFWSSDINFSKDRRLEVSMGQLSPATESSLPETFKDSFSSSTIETPVASAPIPIPGREQPKEPGDRVEYLAGGVQERFNRRAATDSRAIARITDGLPGYIGNRPKTRHGTRSFFPFS